MTSDRGAVRSGCEPILVVDGDDEERALARGTLQQVGYVTRGAASGEEALAAARAERPALVLLEIEIPGLTGYEVCRELRDEYGESLPIIFVSGLRTEPLDRVGGLLLGADDYLVKPVDPRELRARVRRSIDRVPTLSGRPVPDRAAGFGLTDRELEVLEHLALGLPPAEIASRLFIAPKTVGTHIQHVLVKLGVHSQAQAVALAFRRQLVARPDPAAS